MLRALSCLYVGHDDDFCETRLQMLCSGYLELTTGNCRIVTLLLYLSLG